MPSEDRADARVVSRSVGTGAQVLGRVTERVRALGRVDHPGVLIPLSVGVAEGEQVVVTMPWIDGVDLAELESRRGPLSAGECVWLGVRVAAALEALHAQGIAHGDVSPSNVVVAGGQIVLVDTVGGCVDDERGTVGFRAPERSSGATPAADAYSLGVLLRWCVADHDRIPIEAWTAPLVVRDPASRPPVQVVALALASCAPERPVSVPPRSEVVSALRARATERTERIAEGRRWRARRVILRTVAGMAITAAAIGSVVAVPRVVDAAMSAPASSMGMDGRAVGTGVSEGVIAASTHGPAEPSPTAPDRPGPEDAATNLTVQRIRALAEGDGAALRETVGDGPLADETEELAQALDAGTTRYEDLDVEITDVRVTEESPSLATATVVYDVTDHRVVTSEGSADVEGYEQRVELDLRWDGRWIVERARPLS